MFRPYSSFSQLIFLLKLKSKWTNVYFFSLSSPKNLRWKIHHSARWSLTEYHIRTKNLSLYVPTFWKKFTKQIAEATSISKSEILNAASEILMWNWSSPKSSHFLNPN